MRKMALGGDITEMLSDPIVQSAQMCCECGVCEVFACPMGLQPRRINIAAQDVEGIDDRLGRNPQPSLTKEPGDDYFLS